MVNVLIGCTGSVASVKISELVSLMLEKVKGSSVRVVVTENAKHFIKDDFSTLRVPIFCDQDEWQCWQKMGDPVLHIQLRNWSDVFVIAPLDANTLGKMAYGLCDNLVTCVARAWDIKHKPLVFCPAMNTLMWQHPCTERNINILKEYGYIAIPPISKRLACGDEGVGAMADVSDIVQNVAQLLHID